MFSGVGGWLRKRHFDVLRDKLGMDVAPNIIKYIAPEAYLEPIWKSFSHYFREKASSQMFEWALNTHLPAFLFPFPRLKIQINN